MLSHRLLGPLLLLVVGSAPGQYQHPATGFRIDLPDNSHCVLRPINLKSTAGCSGIDRDIVQKKLPPNVVVEAIAGLHSGAGARFSMEVMFWIKPQFVISKANMATFAEGYLEEPRRRIGAAKLKDIAPGAPFEFLVQNGVRIFHFRVLLKPHARDLDTWDLYEIFGEEDFIQVRFAANHDQLDEVAAIGKRIIQSAKMPRFRKVATW